MVATKHGHQIKGTLGLLAAHYAKQNQVEKYFAEVEKLVVAGQWFSAKMINLAYSTEIKKS